MRHVTHGCHVVTYTNASELRDNAGEYLTAADKPRPKLHTKSNSVEQYEHSAAKGVNILNHLIAFVSHFRFDRNIVSAYLCSFLDLCYRHSCENNLFSPMGGGGGILSGDPKRGYSNMGKHTQNIYTF